MIYLLYTVHCVVHIWLGCCPDSESYLWQLSYCTFYLVGALQNHVTQVFGQNLLTSFWLFTPCALSLLCPLRPWSLFRPGPAWHIHWAWVQSAKTRKLEFSALRWTIDLAAAIDVLFNTKGAGKPLLVFWATFCMFLQDQSDGRHHWPSGIPSVREKCRKCQHPLKFHGINQPNYHFLAQKLQIFLRSVWW